MTAKILKFLYYVILICIIAIALLLVVSTFPITGNYKFFVVLSGSMEPAIHTGSIVVVKPEAKYQIGDIITFGPATKLKSPTTHRISDIKVDNLGIPAYFTKGDANNAPDLSPTSFRQIIGKQIFSIPYLGYFVDFIRKPIGFILIIFIPVIFIIYDEVRKILRQAKTIKGQKKEE